MISIHFDQSLITFFLNIILTFHQTLAVFLHTLYCIKIVINLAVYTMAKQNIVMLTSIPFWKYQSAIYVLCQIQSAESCTHSALLLLCNMFKLHCLSCFKNSIFPNIFTPFQVCPWQQNFNLLIQISMFLTDIRF